MKEKFFTKVREGFRKEMAEMSLPELRQLARCIRIMQVLNLRQVWGLLDDIELMVSHKSKDQSSAQAWESIKRGFAKS